MLCELFAKLWNVICNILLDARILEFHCEVLHLIMFYILCMFGLIKASLGQLKVLLLNVIYEKRSYLVTFHKN